MQENADVIPLAVEQQAQHDGCAVKWPGASHFTASKQQLPPPTDARKRGCHSASPEHILCIAFIALRCCMPMT
jgi:hypothetical protein